MYYIRYRRLRYHIAERLAGRKLKGRDVRNLAKRRGEKGTARSVIRRILSTYQ